MIFPRYLSGAAAASLAIAVLVLAGCATGTPAPAPTSSATATPTPTTTAAPTPEAPIATQALLSLDGISVRDQFDSEMVSAPFSDPDAVLALLGGLLGSTPEPVEQFKLGTTYEWPELTLVEAFGTARVIVRAATVAGIPITSTQGIGVGSSRAEVLAASPFDLGRPETLGLEPRSVPEFDSLVFPGQPGTAYIAVFFEGDVVSSLITPSGDYLDV